MPINANESVADAARRIYRDELQQNLEVTNLNDFVTIEPVSGDYFLGKTLSEAAVCARQTYPNRKVHTLRVGHKAAVHFGLQTR